MTTENLEPLPIPGNPKQQKRMQQLRKRLQIRQVVMRFMAEYKIPAKEHADAADILTQLNKDLLKAQAQYTNHLKKMGFSGDFDPAGNPLPAEKAEAK